MGNQKPGWIAHKFLIWLGWYSKGIDQMKFDRRWNLLLLVCTLIKSAFAPSKQYSETDMAWLDIGILSICGVAAVFICFAFYILCFLRGRKLEPVSIDSNPLRLDQPQIMLYVMGYLGMIGGTVEILKSCFELGVVYPATTETFFLGLAGHIGRITVTKVFRSRFVRS